MSERKTKEELFWDRVSDECRALRLPPWSTITPLYTMGKRCPPDEMANKAEWDAAAAEFRKTIARDPDFYADVLPKRRVKK